MHSIKDIEKKEKLLFSLMQEQALQDFYLGGGSALTMYFQHRESLDIDLFTRENISFHEMICSLNKNYQCQELNIFPNVFITKIEGIKVDFVKYQYNLLNTTQRHGNIRLISIDDMAAGKVNSTLLRGAKRDFYDFYFILRDMYRYEQLMDIYQAWDGAKHDEAFINKTLITKIAENKIKEDFQTYYYDIDFEEIIDSINKKDHMLI